jgi:8-oxo-dGTP diphosphatase
LDDDESITECARREVLEETGLQIKQLRHLGFIDKPFEMNQQQNITLFVSAEYESGEAQVLEPDKCESWQWFDYANLPRPLFLPIALFLEQQSALNNNSKMVSSGRNDPGVESCADLYVLHCAAAVMPSNDDKDKCK